MLNKISKSGDVTKWCIIDISLHTIYVIRYGFARCFCWRKVSTPFIKGVCSIPNLYKTILFWELNLQQSQVWCDPPTCRKWERWHFSVETWQELGGCIPIDMEIKTCLLDPMVGNFNLLFRNFIVEQSALHHRSRDADPLMRAAAAQGMTRRVATRVAKLTILIVQNVVYPSHWEHDPLPLWLIFFNCIGTTLVVVISKTVYDKMIMSGPQCMELW